MPQYVRYTLFKQVAVVVFYRRPTIKRILVIKLEKNGPIIIMETTEIILKVAKFKPLQTKNILNMTSKLTNELYV